jgi:CRP-like cAMP-binding protein
MAGRVKIVRSEVDGTEVLLEVRGAGELVGEMSVIDGEDSAVSVTALRPCVTSRVPAARFIDVLCGSDLAIPLLRYAISRRRESDQIRVELSSLPVSLRLVRMLLRLTEAMGTAVSGEIRLELDVPQDELASAIGASRSQVAAALAWLRAQNILNTSRRRVLVRDHARLLAIGAGRIAIG